MLKTLDLFSGIGGFSLGLERTGGFETAAFCERDPWCRRILAQHWPGVPVFDDIKELGKEDLAQDIDVICGGFPCQPWSQAGKREGDKDDRDLWPEMLRVISEVRPKWALGENVQGFVNDPMGLDRTLFDLEAEGYSTRAFMVPACAVQAPHQRNRIWIVAHDDRRRGRTYPAGGDDPARADPGREKANRQPGTVGQPGGARPVADAPGQRRAETGQAGERPTQRVTGSGAVLPDAGRGCGERTGAEIGGRAGPTRWLPEPGVGRVANGIPRRLDRLKGLGNAVVPQVVEQIGNAILKGEFGE